MSEPSPTPLEIALERMTRAITQLARTLAVSDTRHADGQAAILACFTEMREGMTAILAALGHRAQNGAGSWLTVDGENVTARVPRSALLVGLSFVARKGAPVLLAGASALAGWLWHAVTGP